MLEVWLDLCHYWLGTLRSGVFGYTTVLFCQHLQYNVIIDIKMVTTVRGVNIVGIILSMWADKYSAGNDLSFLRVLLMLNMEEMLHLRYFSGYSP